MYGFITIMNDHAGSCDDSINSMNQSLNITDVTISHEHCYMYSDQEEPYVFEHQGVLYHIVFQGNLFNKVDLKTKLLNLGFTFTTSNDSEVVLKSYLAWQTDCLNEFEGGFAFVIDDGKKLFIARDQLGIQPLFYCYHEHDIILATQIKSILAYLNKAVVDQEGVKELLALGPSLSPGKTLYKGVYSLRPGHYMFFQDDIDIQRYWMPKDEVHQDSFPDTVKKVKQYVIESIQKQIPQDHSATMLSGGLDSSIITAIVSQYVPHLKTYSVTYEDQDKYFKAYDYQTTMDDQYIQQISNQYQSQHKQITLTQKQLIDSLEAALIARDMPGMADIDSSFLLFAQAISQSKDICLSGECADEIFGGYPWFYKAELYEQPYFPWMHDLDMKIDMFNEKVKQLHLKDYIQQKYQDTLKEIQTKDLKKQLIYLNLEWFMQTLLTRAITQSTPSQLEVRVPFATTKIVQYLYNMPFEYMFYNHEEKGILRLAFDNVLPADVAHRKKNPFPKTHSPIYTEMIYQKLKESLKDSSNILYQFFDQDKLIEFVETKGQSFQTPWFGQLMMGPQLMAYFYQIYLWGKIYHIELEF